MSKKQDSYYFQNFIDCADYACQAARMLKDTVGQFDVSSLSRRLDEIHEIEHAADQKKHELLNILVKAFITPIEREDILQVSNNLDDMVDKIEDVVIKLYYNRVTAVRPDVPRFVDMLIRCCEEVRALMNDFADFKRSKTLHDHIIRRRRPTSCSSTRCTPSTTAARTRWRSSPGGRSTFILKSASTPANTSPTSLKASS